MKEPCIRYPLDPEGQLRLLLPGGLTVTLEPFFGRMVCTDSRDSVVGAPVACGTEVLDNGRVILDWGRVMAWAAYDPDAQEVLLYDVEDVDGYSCIEEVVRLID